MEFGPFILEKRCGVISFKNKATLHLGKQVSLLLLGLLGAATGAEHRIKTAKVHLLNLNQGKTSF